MNGGRVGAEPSGPFPQGAAQIGDIIAGRFRIESELGSGGMARVFRVTDIATQQRFALKLLRPEIAKDEEAIARLRREGELLDRLDNPAIVGIETYGKLADGRLFLVMELLEGETLGERIRKEHRLDPEALTPIVTGVAAGLHAAHQAGVVHRDLKPDNIFLAHSKSARGPSTQVKILDFGISKAVGFERLTRTGQVLGTPRYMAPEQLAADHDLDARVDVYAMGVILYEALAGQPPFVAVSPSDMIVAILHGKVTALRVYRPELSDDTLAVVSRAMARARDARYGSAHELAEAWIDAAQPRRKPAAAKRGQRTRALGGAELPTAGDAESSADLRPGTFSALEESPPSATPSAGSKESPTVGVRAARPFAAQARAGADPAARAGEAAANEAAAEEAVAEKAAAEKAAAEKAAAEKAGSSAHAPQQPAGSSGPYPAAAEPAPVGAANAPVGTASPADSVPPGPSPMSGTLPQLPIANRRTWLLVVALLAGAATALVVLLLLHFLGDDPASEGRAIESEPAQLSVSPAETETANAPPADEPTAGAAAEAEGSENESDALPVVPAPPIAEAEPPSAASTRTLRRRATTRGRPSAASSTSSTSSTSRTAGTTNTASMGGTNAAAGGDAPPPAAPPPTPLEQAQAALRSGDAQACLRHLDGLRESAAVLRLHGDCLLRSGDRAHAVKTYERFCERYAQHPNLPEVRAIVSRYGGRCP